MDAETTKRCIVCCAQLPLSQFPTNRMMPDGHLNMCFECFSNRGRSAKIEVEKKKRKTKTKQRKLRPRPDAVRCEGLVKYDIEGKPIRPYSDDEEAMKEYMRAYWAWYYESRCTRDPAYKEHRRHLKRAQRLRAKTITN